MWGIHSFMATPLMVSPDEGFKLLQLRVGSRNQGLPIGKSPQKLKTHLCAVP